MTVRIYHNPRCAKSRETLKLLRDRGIEPEIVEYLKHPPSAVELDALLRALGATGRVTGPHLDWRMNWFESRIDPQLLVPPMPGQ